MTKRTYKAWKVGISLEDYARIAMKAVEDDKRFAARVARAPARDGTSAIKIGKAEFGSYTEAATFFDCSHDKVKRSVEDGHFPVLVKLPVVLL